MGNAVATQDKGTLRQWLAQPSVAQDIDRALGGWMRGEDFLAQLMISLADPKLASCTEKSKFAAAHTCAALGMLPSMGHVALIPRKQNGADEVTVMVQWQGLKALLERHPDVLEVNAHLVHHNDVLEYDTVRHAITDHRFDPLDPARKFNDLKDTRGGYVVITYRDGRGPKFHFMTADSIAKNRACAQTLTIWNKWFQQMALKTLYRDAYARRVVPVDLLAAPQLKAALEHDDRQLGNDPSRAPSTVVEQARPAALSRTQQLAQQLTQAPPLEMPAGQTLEPAQDEQPTKRSTGRKKQEQSQESAHADEPPPSDEEPASLTGTPPPNVPAELADAAKEMHKAKDAGEVAETFEYYGNKIEDPDLGIAWGELRDWKLQNLPKQKGQKDLGLGG